MFRVKNWSCVIVLRQLLEQETTLMNIVQVAVMT